MQGTTTEGRARGARAGVRLESAVQEQLPHVLQRLGARRPRLRQPVVQAPALQLARLRARPLRLSSAGSHTSGGAAPLPLLLQQSCARNARPRHQLTDSARFWFCHAGCACTDNNGCSLEAVQSLPPGTHHANRGLSGQSRTHSCILIPRGGHLEHQRPHGNGDLVAAQHAVHQQRAMWPQLQHDARVQQRAELAQRKRNTGWTLKPRRARGAAPYQGHNLVGHRAGHRVHGAIHALLSCAHPAPPEASALPSRKQQSTTGVCSHEA